MDSKGRTLGCTEAVSKVSSGFEFFLLTFAYGSVLAFYLVVLGAEFDSSSNDALLDTCCPAENRSFIANTRSKARFSGYILLTSAYGPELAFYLVVLGAEFNSASDDTLSGGCGCVFIFLLLMKCRT